MSQRPTDPDKLKDYAKLVFGALGGALTSALIGLGDRLGLYQAVGAGRACRRAGVAPTCGGLPGRHWIVGERRLDGCQPQTGDAIRPSCGLLEQLGPCRTI